MTDKEFEEILARKAERDEWREISQYSPSPEAEDLSTLIDVVIELNKEILKLKQMLDPDSVQWNYDSIGVLPEDDTFTFFTKMVEFGEKRISEGEKWMTISLKQYVELLKAAVINAARNKEKSHG